MLFTVVDNRQGCNDIKPEAIFDLLTFNQIEL